MSMSPYKGKSIFIQIASYRDPELKPTLKDLFDKADEPNTLHVCVCWQHREEDDWDDLDDWVDDKRVTILDIDANESKGACWARNMIQQEYTGEDFTFQLDSHHRFVKGWDTQLKNMYYALELEGHKKPLITSYIPAYNADTGKPIDNEPWRLAYNYFGHDGPLHTLPENIPAWEHYKGPVPGRFFSAHFAFANGAFSTDVQHDPEMYFHGEEITLAVRAYTHGYDIFHPHKVIAWHHYGRMDNPKHWSDVTKWGDLNTESYSRVRKLLGINGEKFKKGFKYPYGFGKERTLDEYERFAGVRFKDRAVQQYTIDRGYPPNSNYNTKKAYNNSFINIFKHCIDLQFDQVPEDDYHCWVVVFKNDKGEEVDRQDAGPEEIQQLKNDPDGYIKLWRSFETKDKITDWLVWPNSKENGWLDQINGHIS
jgi:hypothetical protein